MVVGDVTAAVLRTADGLALAARWWDPAVAATPPAAVVLVHGFCGAKDRPEIEHVARRLAAGGRRVLTFDLRGHGGSQGLCTLGWRERLDVDAAVAAARADHDRVVVVGTSLGGIAAIDHLAGGGASRADAAVVVGTPARWQVPWSPAGLIAVFVTQTAAGRALIVRRAGTRVAVRPPRGSPPVEQMRAVDRPVAVIHGLADRLVAARAAQELYAAAPEPRLLDLVPGMGHGLSATAAAPVAAGVAWAVAAAPSPGRRS